MRSRLHTVVLPSEVGDLADEVRQIFAELGRGTGHGGLVGEHAPAVDVYETDDTLEIAVDLPGVDPGGIRVVIKGDALLIAGEKAARQSSADSTFHLVERGFGRFARTVRIGLPYDAARTRAVLGQGELRITLPKIAERRGRRMTVAIEPSPHSGHRTP